MTKGDSAQWFGVERIRGAALIPHFSFSFLHALAGASPQEVKVGTVSVSKRQQCAVVFYKTLLDNEN